jgi:class 3 adenylate cyclase
MADQALTYSLRPHARSNATSHVRPVRDPLLGTERKLATIMSVDMKGSMALSRSIELEEWWLVIAELFEDMCEGVSLFGGWVMAFTGDGVMAVGGAPSPGLQGGALAAGHGAAPTRRASAPARARAVRQDRDQLR